MAEAGNMLEQGMKDDDKPVSSNGMPVRYQPPMVETWEPVCTSTSAAGITPESDSHPDEMQDFFMNSDFMKVLMDEQLCSLDSLPPFILSDFAYDGSWESVFRK